MYFFYNSQFLRNVRWSVWGNPPWKWSVCNRVVQICKACIKAEDTEVDYKNYKKNVSVNFFALLQ